MWIVCVFISSLGREHSDTTLFICASDDDVNLSSANQVNGLFDSPGYGRPCSVWLCDRPVRITDPFRFAELPFGDSTASMLSYVVDIPVCALANMNNV